MRKTYLLTPGPTPVPSNVLEAMARPIIHHRTSGFQEIFKTVNENLKYVFCTKDDVLTFASSGTGAMEGCVANLLNQGDTVIVVQGGKFGERWAEICKVYGINIISIDVKWETAVKPHEIENALDANPNTKAVFITHCETSTGASTDVKAIAEVVSRTDAVLVVDAISSLCAMELRKDLWNVDVVVSGSQKGLMIPPGLAFCSLNNKAWQLAEKSKLPKYYFDFLKARKSLQKTDTPYTPAVNLIIGLCSALQMIQAEGLENIWARHARLATATRGAMKAMGLELFSKTPANSVTAIKSPSDVDSEQLVKLLRTKYGVNIAEGQAELKGKIFRIAHLGYMNEFDILVGIAAVGMGLGELGCKLDIGKGIGAAEKAFSENKVCI